MKKLTLVFLLSIAFALGVSAQAPAPVDIWRGNRAADPATCSSVHGERYYNTATKKYRFCSATNTWSDIGTITTATTLPAGTVSAAPLNFTAGTNLTTPTAGALEYDGKVFYGDFAASQRGVALTQQFASNTSNTTLNSDANVQSVFAAADDTLTVLANTTYFFEAEYFLTTGTTTHTTATAFGGTATFTSVNYWAELWSNTDGTISTTAPSVLRIATNSATVLNATSTAAGTVIRLKGVIRTANAGTIIPQIKFSANPTGTNLGLTNSYFRLAPVGTDTATKVGPWS